MVKRVTKVLGIAVVLLLAVAVALPFLLDANQFRPLLQTRLSAALGRQVTLGGLQLSIFSGAVKADDLSIADDPVFSKTPFLRAKSLAIGVEVMPLILSRRANVTGITIQTPEIELIQTETGVWNFSSLGSSPGAKAGSPAEPAPSVSAAATPELSVELVKLSGGRLTLARLGTKAKPLILDKMDLEVKGFSPTSSFPFSLAATFTGEGEIKLDGKAGPIEQGDAISTPFDANLHVTHLDVVLSGILDASLGVAGLVSIDGKATSSNSALTITGKLKDEQMKLVKGGSPAKSPAELEIALTHDLKKQMGTLSRADIHLGKALATVTGTYNLHGQAPAVNLKLSGHDLPVTELAGFLPAIAVVLPAGATIDQGTAAVDINASGALSQLVASGTVGLQNTRLANYDFASKMKVLEGLAGIKAEPQTTIQSFSAKVQAAPDGMQVQDLNMIVPSFGDFTGAGTVSPNQALNFKMRVALRSGGTVIPFTIGGTSSDPSFKPDVKGLVSDQLKGLTSSGKAADAATGLLNGLLGGRKKPK